MVALIFDPIFSPALIIAVVLAVLGLMAWSYLAWSQLSSRRWRVLLIGLRTAAIAVVAVILFGPAQARSERIVEKAHIAFLLDRSKSMELPQASETDESGRLRTRAAALQETLCQNREAIERLAGMYSVSFVEFGASTASVESADLWSGKERDDVFRARTDLGGALAQAVEEMKGRRNGALILLSDGRSNGTREPVAIATTARTRGVPVFAVPFGQETESDAIKDVKVINVISPARARLNASVLLDVELSALGLRGKTLNVTLKVDGKAVGNKQHVPTQMKETFRLQFLMVASPIGQHEITVEAAAVPGEIDTANNSFATLMWVEDERVRVVYLEGRLRWEYRYLRDFLRGLKLIDAEIFNCFDDRPLPDEAFNLNARSVMIIGDIAATRFSKEQIEKLRDAVSVGAGLIVLGGQKNLGPGGYGASPLAELLPVTVGANDAQVDESFALRLAPGAPNHYAIRMASNAEKTAEWLSRLPPLDGGVAVGPLKPGGIALLLAAPVSVPPPAVPSDTAREVRLPAASMRTVLAGLQYGKGRTLVLTADSTWKWAIGPEGERQTYRCFWQQIIGWLGRWEEAQTAALLLRLPRYRFLRDEAVEIEADLTAFGKPIPGCPVGLRVRSPSGREERLNPGFFGGAYQTVYYPKECGRYSLYGYAQIEDGKRVTSDETQFLVTLPDPELDTPLADHGLMRRVGEASGGRLAHPQELGQVLERLVAEGRNTVIEKTLAPQPLWDRSLTAVLFCGLLALEWGLRRYKRLV